MATVIPVILCGGSGTRLWPLSRARFPKQFLALSSGGSSQSLFQEAVVRINAIAESKEFNGDINLGSTIVVTNEEYRFLVLDQLRELDAISTILLLESSGRNTAPALSMAAFHALQSSEDDPILVVTPSDQTIQSPKVFISALQNCIRAIQNDQDAIAILGIKPTAAETGYGYIERSGSEGSYTEYTVDRFVEKPDAKKAQTYFEDGNYLWNAGIFVLRASTWLAALQEFRPDILEASKKAWLASSSDGVHFSRFIRPGEDEFKDIPGESIDYAVIEKCPGSRFSVKMVELNAGWNDLGAWEAVWQVGSKDLEKNVVSGEVMLSDSKNCLVYSSSRLVSAVGLENIIIIETPDAVLVIDKSKSQDVKNVVKQLGSTNNELKDLHRKVSRPWGWYDSLDQGEGFKVKRIQVNPGASLSLQKHQHRAEHWVVVRGVAEITNGDRLIILNENQSTYIPKGQIHRLKNPGNSPLEIIEVQSGEYLGEDDIVRSEDSYGRL